MKRLLPLIAITIMTMLFVAWLFTSNRATTTTLAAELKNIHYGYEPLLLDPDSHIRFENGLMMLRWPQQPALQSQWKAAECFGFSYAVREQLLGQPGVKSVYLGNTRLAANLGKLDKRVANHVVAIVNYSNGEQVNIDLTPLGSDHNPQYIFNRIVSDPARIDEQFQHMRSGVPLDHAAPMKVIERDGKHFYVMAAMMTDSPHVFEAQLRIYDFTPATESATLQFHRGIIAAIISDFDDQIKLKNQMAAKQTIQLALAGDLDPDLRALIDENIYILKALISKFDPSSAPRPNATVSVPTAEAQMPEDKPEITIKFAVVDAATGKALPQAVIMVQSPNGLVGLKKPELKITIVKQNEINVPVTVTADGYQVWSQTISMRLLSSRTVTVPIEMKPQ